MGYRDFERPATITGAVHVEGVDGFRMWLGQNIGSISQGTYEGSAIVVVNGGLGVYLRRRGRSVGSIRIDLTSIVAAAVAQFEEEEVAVRS